MIFYNKKDLKKFKNSDRWDRIRKKYSISNSSHFKTEVIKKLISKDFINEKQIQTLSGNHNKNGINPSIVMDLRHKMVIKTIKQNSIPHSSYEKMKFLENTKTRNQFVENRFMENELEKFRKQLQLKRPKINIESQCCIRLADKNILDSIENFQLCIIQNGEKPSPLVNGLETHDSEVISNSPKPEKILRFKDSIETIDYTENESISSSWTENNNDNDVQLAISQLVNKAIYEAESESQIILKQNDEKNNLQISDNFNDDILKVTRLQQKHELNHCNRKIFFSNYSEEEISDDIPTTESTEQSEQNAIIAELFRPQLLEKELLRRYFLRWMYYVTIEKVDRKNITGKNNQIQKINAFLDNIRNEKRRLTGAVHQISSKFEANYQNVTALKKSYQNKIKIQKDIIELQKLKLERQERVIMELRLSKLSEEARKCRDELKNELKYRIRNGDFNIRSKAKCLQLAGNLRDEDDENFEKIQGKSLMTPKFLERMQRRALERSIKHEQARQRRLQLEADKEAAKLAAEEAKRLEDEEAKRQRLEALKRKRIEEKMIKIQKEIERKKHMENIQKSQQFYRHYLLHRIGMEGFRRLLCKKRTNQKKAVLHYRCTIKKKVFNAWKAYCNRVWEVKQQIADDFYIKIIKRMAFKCWIAYIANERSKYFVAVDWYDLKITEYYFKRWYNLMKLEQIIENTKMKQAILHYQWHLKWKVIDRWIKLPQVLKLEKETEERRYRWRVKIWELLPDYKPNCDYPKV